MIHPDDSNISGKPEMATIFFFYLSETGSPQIQLNS